jgi:hypothetical protein
VWVGKESKGLSCASVVGAFELDSETRRGSMLIWWNEDVDGYFLKGSRKCMKIEKRRRYAF